MKKNLFTLIFCTLFFILFYNYIMFRLSNIRNYCYVPFEATIDTELPELMKSIEGTVLLTKPQTFSCFSPSNPIESIGFIANFYPSAIFFTNFILFSSFILFLTKLFKQKLKLSRVIFLSVFISFFILIITNYNFDFSLFSILKNTFVVSSNPAFLQFFLYDSILFVTIVFVIKKFVLDISK